MRALDLYCGAGGASWGYHLAGYEIVGVDIDPQPHYPFPYIQGDVRDMVTVGAFDLVHASPPCQHFTAYRRRDIPGIEDRYNELIGPTRHLLETSGIPYVIENVPGAPIRPDLILCGSMFGLNVRRHRWFELGGFPAWAPGGCNHKGWSRRYKGSTNRPNLRYTVEIGAWDEPLADQRAAMGIPYEVTLPELSEMIPPAYTEWIGHQYAGIAVTT